MLHLAPLRPVETTYANVISRISNEISARLRPVANQGIL